jgi:hypothetical protein
VIHYEANLTYNIMIINLAYETIPKFKAERRGHFAQTLKRVCQSKVVQENELHGFFKFVLNFYQSDF